MMTIQVVGVAVNDNNRIINDHSEHEDEGRQRDRIQFDTCDIHQADTDRRAYRQAGSCHEGGTEREEHQHHGNDHQDGDEDIP